MTSSGVARDVGAAIGGQLTHCEHRKEGRERVIRKTGAHRGRPTALDSAPCVTRKRHSRDPGNQGTGL